jgi:hypothetical protein
MSPAAQVPAPPAASHARLLYLRLLEWAFTLFSSVRVLAYLPTTWAIHSSGDSSQHSLWTWCTWLGANATMAAWLHAHNGGRMNKAVLVNAGNATMCGLTVAVILAYRF